MSSPKANLEVLPRGVQVALALCVVALAAFPFVGTDFYTQMVTRMMIMAIFAMSLDLLQGVTGLVSLGHAAFFGIAGYALAFLTPQGEPVTLAAAPAVWNSDQQSEPPASRAQATRLPGPTRSPAGDQRRYVAESEALLHAGLYRVERFLRSGGVEVEPFTVSIDPSEGELRKAGDAALLAALHGAPIELVHDLTALSDQRSRGRAELWPSIAIGLVTLLCVEQTLAWWFGIRRQ